MKSKKSITRKINQYFSDLKGGQMTDADGTPIYDKKGNPLSVPDKPPTVAGLCRALGLGSREELGEYSNDDVFGKEVRAALMRIEEYTESRLFDRDAAKGAETILKNEFSWHDRSVGNEGGLNCGVVLLSEIKEDGE